MTTFFIADLHLSEAHPSVTEGFLRFLEQLNSKDSLYILGDLFEFWVGDDAAYPPHLPVTQALSALAKRGIQCFFIHGNRDFLIGSRFAKASNLVLLPEIQQLSCYGHNIVILHGDILCTDDSSYQRIRKILHLTWVQKIFLCLPIAWRLKIAYFIRQKSQQTSTRKSSAMLDVNPEAVSAMLQQYPANWMIHGHTHHLAIHNTDHPSAKRVVLGAWGKTGSMVKVDEKSVALIEFPLPAQKPS